MSIVRTLISLMTLMTHDTHDTPSEKFFKKKFDFYSRTAMQMSYLCVRFKNLTRASAALGIAR